MQTQILRGITVVLLTTIALAGCYMRVRISSGENSPDGKLRAAVVAHTAPGEGYDERKRKDVYVSIYKTGVEPTDYVFKTHFGLVGPELDWKIHWSTPDQVSVEFYVRKSPNVFLKTVIISRANQDSPFKEIR